MILAVAAVAGMAWADGQETGVISGVVTDASGAPIPGVRIAADAGRGAREAFTDEKGEFRIALLVPGEYRVTANMDGFDTMEAATQVSGGARADVNFRLSMGTSEEITVTSEAPMVDKYNVTAGSTVTSEVGQETAGTTRTYYGVINTLPGVSSDSQNADIQGTRPTVNGSNWADQQVFIDGVDSSFARFGGSRVYIPTSAVTEVTMEAGGSSAEYGRAVGSTTNVIVKSGTNKFHGDLLWQRQETAWQSDYDSHVELTQRQNFPEDPNFFKRDFFGTGDVEEDGKSDSFELGFGGPLARDKAWFFLAWSDVSTNDIDRTLNGDAIDVSLNTEARIAKFNVQPAPAHSLSFSWIDTPADRVYFNPESNDLWTPTPHVSDGTLGTLSWNWSASNNFFLEAKIATQQSDENKFLACGSTDPGVCLAQKQQDPRFAVLPGLEIFPHSPVNNFDVYRDSQNDGAWNNGWLLDNGFGTNEFPRDQANLSLTQFAGSNHELKYGIDWQTVEWDANIQGLDVYDGGFFNAFNPFGFDAANGGIGPLDCGIARTNASTVAFANSLGIPATRALGTCAWTTFPEDMVLGSGNTKNEDLAFYVRDRFTSGDHWTFNLGLRYENAVAENDTGREVVDANNFAPRLSATYDIRGDGQMLFSANVGRYYAQLNQQWVQEHLRDNPNGEIGSDQVTWLFCDFLDVTFGLPGCAQNGVGYNFRLRELRSGRMWELVDQGYFQSDIDPYYKDEVILGFEWQVAPNWALDVKGLWWELDDMIGATIQLSPESDQFKLLANYNDYADILRNIGFVDNFIAANTNVFPDESPEQLAARADAILNNYEPGKMEYQAIQLQLNRRFANGWALFNNVTFSETETSGAGAWWNNTNSDYGEDLHVVLTQDHIDSCQFNQTNPNAQGRTRTVPVDCSVLTPFLGQPVSTINRVGKANNIDRPIIWNTFGFKRWAIGSHDLTIGGHFQYQDGLPWQRTEGVSTIALDGNTAANSGVTLYVEERGARRLTDIYAINMSMNWGFPISGQVRGGLRVEGLNVTNEQERTFTTSRGEIGRVRRNFQRPRQFRASLSLKF